MGGIIFFPMPSGEAYFPDSSGIKTFAENQITQAVTNRDGVLADLYAKLNEFNDNLESLFTTPLLDASILDRTVTPPPPVERPVKPVKPNFPSDFPAEPADAQLGSISPVNIDNPPTFDSPEIPIRTVTPPEKFNKAAPTATPIPTRTMPNEPGFTLPATVTLRDLGEFPTPPTTINVQFEGILPAELAAPPNLEFNFTEQEFDLPLNELIKSKLYDLILNLKQTGLSDSILKQIWDKEREAVAAVADSEIETGIDYFGLLGWNQPPGDERNLVRQAYEKARRSAVTEERNISIETAKLEQNNFQFALSQSSQHIGLLIGLHNNVQQRAFDAERVEIETLARLYELRVTYYNAGVRLYEVNATVFTARIQAEIAKLELYGKQLEAKKILNEINRQDIDNYLAQLQGVKTLFEIFKDRLEAVKIQLEGDALVIQQFEAQIRAFAEEIKAKSLEYDGYKSELSGEEIKARIQEILANVFGKQVDAYGIVNDIKLKKLDSDIKINIDAPLQVAAQNAEIYKSKIQAIATKIDGLAKQYQTDGQVYESETKAIATLTEADVARARLDLEYIQTDIDSVIKVFHENVLILLAQKDYLIQAKTKETQLLSQIAASIGSTIHMGATISGSSQYPVASPQAFVF